MIVHVWLSGLYVRWELLVFLGFSFSPLVSNSSSHVSRQSINIYCMWKSFFFLLEMVVIVVMNCYQFRLMMSHKRVPFDKYTAWAHTHTPAALETNTKKSRKSWLAFLCSTTIITSPFYTLSIWTAFVVCTAKDRKRSHDFSTFFLLETHFFS